MYPIDNSVVIEYCELYNRLRQYGRLLSDNNLIIAATAKAHGEKLITRDSAFQALSELGLLEVEII